MTQVVNFKKPFKDERTSQNVLHTHTTCRLVVPGLSPTSTCPSSSWATLASFTLSESLTSCVTSTCQSVPRRKFCWPSPSSSVGPPASLPSATKCVRTRRVLLWYWATQGVSVLSSAGSPSSLSSVTLSYLKQRDERSRWAMEVESITLQPCEWKVQKVLRRKRHFEGQHRCNFTFPDCNSV